MNELINLFKQKGYLLSPELMELNLGELEEVYSKIQYNPFKLKILDNNALQQISLRKQNLEAPKHVDSSVEVIRSVIDENVKRNATSFVEMYNDRFNKISSYIKKRPEMSNANSIKNIIDDKNSDNLTFIGLVSDVNISKNNNYIITLEDPTGIIRVMITEKDADLYTKAQDVIQDEVIGITGSKSRGYVFAKNIYFPEMPNTYEFKKSSDEAYAVFVSDLHIGASTFMEESFIKFIDWLSGKTGSQEQRDVASKVRYLFVTGDAVDGVGIYPTQESDLVVKTIEEQFAILSNFLKKVPEHIQIIMTPGNHDGVRLEEPQPPYPVKYLSELYEKKNFTFVSNPAYVKIHAVKGEPGFTVLTYHGYSFDHYCLDVQSLRNAGGYGAVEKVVEFLLKKRHLAPTHGSTVLIPSETDKLVIDIVPDIIVTGHVHNLRTGSYNHISIVACACFEMLTGETYAEKLGHKPTPALVPLLNLKTRKFTIMDFN